MRHVLIAALISATASAEQLQITVYDKAHLPKEVREAAFYDLRCIFRQSRIDLLLIPGDPAAAEASLLTYPAPPRRGGEQEAVCRARRDIALDIIPVAPPGLKRAALGMVQPLAHKGLNVRIFDDRVRDAAWRQSRPHPAVLAHVMAHEIGHVLLRSSAHSHHGLMSSVWTEHEYDWMAKALMFFTGGQSQEMRANLSRSRCPDAEALPQHGQPVAARRVNDGVDGSGQ